MTNLSKSKKQNLTKTKQDKTNSARKNENRNIRPCRKTQKLSFYLVLFFKIFQVFLNVSVISCIFTLSDLDSSYGF